MQQSHASKPPEARRRPRRPWRCLGFCLPLLLGGLPPALQAVELEARPKVCVTLDSGSPCEMRVEVHWRSRQADDFCLKLKHSGQVLECWRGATEGRFDFSFSHQGELVLQLFAAGQDQPLGEQRLITVSRELRDARRRRRHVWSIL